MANTSRPSLGSQIKDFGTKTHFFFFKKKVRKSAFSCHFKEITLFVPYQPNTHGIEYWWRG